MLRLACILNFPEFCDVTLDRQEPAIYNRLGILPRENATVQEVDKTNRKQFITELSKYLASMTPEEQDAIINRYELRFDEAGPEGEQPLLDSLGSPMKVAIALFREHNAEVSDAKYVAPDTDAPAEAGALAAAEPPAPPQDEPAAEAGETLPEPEPQFVPVEAETLSAVDGTADDTAPAAPEAEPADLEESGDDGFDLDLDEDDGLDDAEDRPGPAANGAAVTGSVVLCAVTVIVGLALLTLPATAVYLGIRTLISGFASFAYLPDTLLLLGIGAVSTGVGLAVAWVVIWMAVTVIKALRRRILARTGRLPAQEGGPEL